MPRAGKWWLLIAAVCWATGLVKGINLVTLLGSTMLAAWCLNASSARRGVRHLRFRRRVHGPVFAGTAAAVEAEVENLRGAQAVGLRLEDGGPDHRLVWHLPALRSQVPLRLRGEITLPRRGRYVGEPPRAVSRQPFGLAEASVTTGLAEPITVLPRLGCVHRGRLRRFLRQVGGTDGRSAGRPVRHPAALGELYGVRVFRDGDSPRWVHWPTSARRGEMMVREFEEAVSEDLVVILEAWVPPAEADRESACLEEAVSLAATVCWEWCRQKEDHLTLGVAGKRATVRGGTTGRELALELLETLAVEPGDASPDMAGLIDLLTHRPLPPGPVLLVTTRPGDFRATLAERLRRPVACVEVAGPAILEFYEGPAADAR